VHTRTASALLAAAVVLACSACGGSERTDDAPEAAEAAPLRTNATSYVLIADSIGWGAQVMLNFRNTAEDTLYAVNCNGALTFALERDGPSGWAVVLAPATNGCLSPPITIAPGETFITPWGIYGARPGGNAGPQFADSTFGGGYRLVWWNLRFHYDPEREQMGDTVPLRYRVSNVFGLTRSDGP
jgi:hypothetical protein